MAKSFKLKKEYPGSPGKGAIHTFGKTGEWLGIENYEQYPEYWEETKIDWEVLEFVYKQRKYILEPYELGDILCNYKRVTRGGLEPEYFEDFPYYYDNIYVTKVRRLNDGKVFEIDDKVFFDEKYWYINEFDISDDFEMLCVLYGEEKNGYALRDECSININEIMLAKFDINDFDTIEEVKEREWEILEFIYNNDRYIVFPNSLGGVQYKYRKIREGGSNPEFLQDVPYHMKICITKVRRLSDKKVFSIRDMVQSEKPASLGDKKYFLFSISGFDIIDRKMFVMFNDVRVDINDIFHIDGDNILDKKYTEKDFIDFIGWFIQMGSTKLWGKDVLDEWEKHKKKKKGNE